MKLHEFVSYFREETQHSSLDSDSESRSDSVRYSDCELCLLLWGSGVCGPIALLESEFYSKSHQSLIIYIEHITLHAAGAQQAGVRAGPMSYYIYCSFKICHSFVIWSVCPRVKPEVRKMEAAIFTTLSSGTGSFASFI